MEQVGGSEESLGLSFAELEQKAKELHDKYKNIYPIESEERKGLEQELPEYVSFITLPKASLNPNVKFPTHYRPDDAIEIKIERDTSNNLVWSIRNRSLAEQENRPFPAGEIKEGTREDMQRFIDEVDPRRIGLHHLKPILEELGSENKEQKLYFFIIPEGEIAGIAYMKGNHLSRLATNPDFENRGIGSALIADLKRRYEYISVSPMPFDMTNPDRASAFERLRTFYRQNGFVGGTEWSKHTISLDDFYAAGNWQAIDENTIYNVGVDQHHVSTTDIKRCVLGFILSGDSLVKKFPPEIIEKFHKWNTTSREMKSLEEDQEQTGKELERARTREH